MDHTPTPWRAAGAGVYLERPGLDMLALVAQCPRREHSPTIRKGEAEANAAFIAHACNAHDELLAALQAVLAEPNDAAWDAARRAVQRATGESA